MKKRPARRRVNSNLRKTFFFAIFIFATISFFYLYSSGYASFIRRKFELRSQFSEDFQKINSNSQISLKESIFDHDGSISSVDLEMQSVVFSNIRGNTLKIWDYDGLLDEYLIKDSTKYGILMVVEKQDLNRGKVRDLIKRGELEVLEGDFLYQDNRDSILVIEKERGEMSRKKYEEILRAGNLIKIIYNKVTKDLLGLLILDFRRI